MNLIIDAGNTRIKLAVFAKNNIVYETIASYVTNSSGTKLFSDEVHLIFKKYQNIKDAIISSVGNFQENELALISDFCKLHVINQSSKLPFKNAYKTPKTLGVDRVALATAAYYKNPKGNSLIIDAGTCITYDFLDEKDVYKGGAISPGVSMRYEALHNQTSKLPLLEKEYPEDFMGNTTASSIHSGVVNGVCQEIEGVIKQYESRIKDLTVILTGGDAHFLSKRLKNGIFADSKFLLMGLNHLLEYNK